ncbi:uncharacterized protein si:ch211-130h14.4 isoform X1 [Anguilla anguilla]|uniref:uncharacterized protein si:ch211-130h14.4 isoform X1 n=2 Tax=Anguilla anguilla TaxID=7936 RepID=UPI0015B06E90|nr:uncharacterized protein si:ch211-130h14.4 isoform X1 [Anguilla anguilla]XP_035257087.1 uncharacterized protein si:ch211-130h14.4 isoform X1 [Anguilla anguilla]
MCDLKMKYKGLDIHHTSSLPSILDKYVSTGCIKQDTEKKQFKKQSRVGEDEDGRAEGFLVSPRSDLEEEAKIQQKTILAQRHLEVYRNMHLLQGGMRRRYAALLRQKVSKQRQEIKQREPPTHKPPESSREQLQGGVTGQRLPFCALSHNDAYLRSLPKTGYYLIVELQNQLAQRGCLKTQQDQERFWSMVGQNRNKARLESRLREIQGIMIGGRSAPPDRRSVRFTQKETFGPAPIIKITTGGESHQEEAVLSEGEPGHRQRGKHPQERAEIEQMFPKVTVPKFATLQPGFLEQFKPRTLSQLKICEPPQKTRETELSVLKLRLMHSRSLTNMAATQRLLNGKRMSLHWEEENSIRSLMQYVFPTDDSRVKQKCTGKQFLPCLPPKTTVKETSAPSPQHNTAPPTRITTPEVIPAEAEIVAPKPPDPLTLEEVSQQHTVVVIDRLCKTWTNYVGNSNTLESPESPSVLGTSTTMTLSTTTKPEAEKSENVPSYAMLEFGL